MADIKESGMKDQCQSSESNTEMYASKKDSANKGTTGLTKKGEEKDKKATDRQIRIVLIGKSGVGKSATANTLVGRNRFNEKAGIDKTTLKCQWATTAICNTNTYRIIETPGFLDYDITDPTVLKEIAMSIQYAAPGPHVFLFVIRYGQFSEQDCAYIESMKKLYGDECAKDHGVILFTHGDDIKYKMNNEWDNSGKVEKLEYLKECEKWLDGSSEDTYIKELFDACSGRIFIIDNRSKGRKAEASRFYEKLQEWGLAKSYCRDVHRIEESIQQMKMDMAVEMALEKNCQKEKESEQICENTVHEHEEWNGYVEPFDRVLQIIKEALRQDHTLVNISQNNETRGSGVVRNVVIGTSAAVLVGASVTAFGGGLMLAAASAASASVAVFVAPTMKSKLSKVRSYCKIM
ncbi:unnamed protein product [Owenia fusiformis]|uniref:AIG1-type G domain-containing protein n=1 Tax=Owenia fusiformis TaxID=6347 RepID=A0A8S4NE15_OWEFU|nr:unnamed protein product [Owenia fusiformis]